MPAFSELEIFAVLQDNEGRLQYFLIQVPRTAEFWPDLRCFTRIRIYNASQKRMQQVCL